LYIQLNPSTDETRAMIVGLSKAFKLLT